MLDGASSWQTFCRITLPLVWKVVAVAVLTINPGSSISLTVRTVFHCGIPAERRRFRQPDCRGPAEIGLLDNTSGCCDTRMGVANLARLGRTQGN